MATETNVVCDVFTKFPRLKLDDVQPVTVEVRIGDGPYDTTTEHKVLCKKARERLLKGIDRLLQPPAKRKKESDG